MIGQNFEYVSTDQHAVNHNFDRLIEFLAERDRKIQELESTIGKLITLTHVHKSKKLENLSTDEGGSDDPKPS